VLFLTQAFTPSGAKTRLWFLHVETQKMRSLGQAEARAGFSNPLLFYFFLLLFFGPKEYRVDSSSLSLLLAQFFLDPKFSKDLQEVRCGFNGYLSKAGMCACLFLMCPKEAYVPAFLCVRNKPVCLPCSSVWNRPVCRAFVQSPNSLPTWTSPY
jgi:hypothetical protein